MDEAKSEPKAGQHSMGALFHQELSAGMAAFEQCLERLTKDPQSKEPINCMVAVAHELKGAALIMGFKPIAQLSQALENYLNDLTSLSKGCEELQLKTLSEVNGSLQRLMHVEGSTLQDSLVKNREEIEQLVDHLIKQKTALFTFTHRFSDSREGVDPVIFDEGIASAISEEKSTGNAPLAGDRKLCEKVKKAQKTGSGNVATQTVEKVPEGVETPSPEREVFSEAESALPDPSLLGLFFVDLETQTRELAQGLLSLETNPQDKEVLASLMRAAHSIKGAARVLGLEDLMKLARAIEECFVSIQKNPGDMNSNVTDLLLKTVDSLTSLAKIDPDSVNLWLKDNAGQLKSLTESLNSHWVPSEEAVQEKQAQREELSKPDKASKAAFKRLQEAKHVYQATKRERVLRLTADYLTRLMGLAGELLVESRWLQPFADELLKLKKAQYDLSAIVDVLRSSYNEKLFGEEGQENLLELQRKTHLCRQSLAERLEELELFIRRHGALSDRLYREIISSRLCPFIEGVEEFPRLVRDLARQLNKKVIFELIGRSTTIDRDILDKLQSPLNHLLRNAIDHGIESPEERVAKGKKPEGLIRLEARHRAGVLTITVSDDGRGLNMEKLRQLIVYKKLVEPAMATQLTETELLDFLFLPGFSTVNKVTDLSGRGIGLNVVQSMVHEVGGQVRVNATDGQGMTFCLHLPLTLSVLRTLLVEIGGEPYAFPLGRVEKAVVVDRDQVSMLEERHYIKIDDQNIGLIPGHQILGFPDTGAQGNELSIVVLSDNFNLYGVVVDRLLGEKELVVQELDQRLGKISDISCGALMEDGAPVLIIDAEDMVRSVDNLLTTGHLERLREIDTTSIEQRRKRILVVDDSITVREVECRILENENYEVDVAVNGIDGWNSVRIEDYDLVVTDIDMPRMNGIELVRLIKNDPRLRHLPVMIVSYKERGEDRKMGLDAGADYYLAKSSFHDDTFIQRVKDLLGD